MMSFWWTFSEILDFFVTWPYFLDKGRIHDFFRLFSFADIYPAMLKWSVQAYQRLIRLHCFL